MPASRSWGNRELSPRETGRNRHPIEPQKNSSEVVPPSTAGTQPASGWALGQASLGAEGESVTDHPLPMLWGKPFVLPSQLALDSFTPSLFALGYLQSKFRLRVGKQVSEDTCTPHIWPLMSGERGAGSCLQLPGRRYLALCRSSPARRVTAAVCCCQPNAASPLLRGSVWDPNLGLVN